MSTPSADPVLDRLRRPRHGIAYGGWRLAGSEGVTPAPDQPARGRAAVRAALEAGIELFDLADIYGGGRCEEIFGEALRDEPGARDRILVATKCGIRRPDDPAPGAPYRYDFSAEHIEASVRASLRRMGIGQVDLLLLHRPDFLMDPAEVAGVFALLRDRGWVRHFGVSNFRPSQLTALQAACPFPLVAHQVEISLARQEALEDGTLDQCLALGISPQAWSPLARGALGTASGDTPLGRVMAAVGVEIGADAAGVALAWLRRHPARIVPVVGTTDPGRIAAAVRSAGCRLSREQWYRLTEAARGVRLP